MKTFIMLLLLCLPFALMAQNDKTCCALSAASQFAALSDNRGFVNSHPEPIPFVYAAERGKFVTFKTSDGSEGHAFEIKSSKPTTNVIFMIHEWWGLNDYIQQEAEGLQKELGDVTVPALDLYDGKIATTREDAGKFIGEMKEERAKSIIKGAIDYVGPKVRIGTIGWCFGGGWSLQSSLLAGKQAAACVMYYGMPETDVEKLKSLNAPVLGIFAKQDDWVNETVVKKFEDGMKKANKKLTTKWYDAVHAFANPSNPKHDKEATADAYKRVIEFYKKNLLK